MLNSILTATIVEGRGLRRVSTGYIVILGVEGQKAQSEPVETGGQDPVWNEIITFDIQTGREPLYIQIIDLDGTRILGQSEVYLDNLMDQYKHDEWIQLEDAQTSEPAGRLRLNLHWIHSKRKFLQDILRIQDAALEEETNERLILKDQLESMKKPFTFLTSYYKQEEVLQSP